MVRIHLGAQELPMFANIGLLTDKVHLSILEPIIRIGGSKEFPQVVELVYTHVLGTCAKWRVGSSPTLRTNINLYK